MFLVGVVASDADFGDINATFVDGLGVRDRLALKGVESSTAPVNISFSMMREAVLLPKDLLLR